MKHRLEEMLPAEIRLAIQTTPWILVPIGAIEWHGHHNPVGLDGLKAHHQLLRVAEVVGGVVYPPIYTGHYTRNTIVPHTFMIRREALHDLLIDLLTGFQADGFLKAVLLCGHYPNHIFVGREVVKQWRSGNPAMEVLSLRECNLHGIRGDHAAREETSMLMDLIPGLVELDRIQYGDVELGTEDQPMNWLETDLSHPCHGITGIDPRPFSNPERGERLNAILVDAIAGWIRHGAIDLKHGN